ncbi:hypothetical protein CC78DRAFT_569906 [Lojkania enalia]|uniref:Uncharacterized protein n=1 Tax=Lojkania enalia TaxID=147567 RepID=A0A9P4K488_9PLEO|nr:hypothetical protein CC78DRAFT_569906 [Didymosphaeria enalia]
MIAPLSEMSGNSAAPSTRLTVAPNGDLIIRLAPPAVLQTSSAGSPLVVPKFESPSILAYNGANRPRQFEFRVSRSIVTAHSDCLRATIMASPNLSIINVNDHSIRHALELWLRAVHGNADNLPQYLQATHAKHAWNAIAIGEQYGFSPQHSNAMKTWFTLFLPKRTSTGRHYQSCPASGVSVLLFRPPGSFHEIDQILRQASCHCRKVTTFDYESALESLGIWPIASAIERFTVAQIIEKLKKFEFNPDPSGCNSGACRHDFKKSVEIAIRRVNADFHGLCLNCMNRSERGVGQSKQDYFRKNSPDNGCWDMGCRFGHGHSTWRYSWMGLAADRKAISIKHQRNNEERIQKVRAAKGLRAVQSGLSGGSDESDYEDEFFDAKEETY